MKKINWKNLAQINKNSVTHTHTHTHTATHMHS